MTRTGMKILFVSFNDPSKNPGGYRKEVEYCREMKSACASKGIEFAGVNVFSDEDGATGTLPGDPALEVCRVHTPLIGFFSRFRLIRAVFRTGPVLREAVERVRRFRPRVILFRYSFVYILRPFNPKKIDQSIFFFSIHHSKEPAELRMNPLACLFVPLERWLARWFFRSVDGVIGVTEEITRYESERINRDVPVHVMPNCINVAAHEARTESSFTGDDLKMVFIAGVYDRWQGLDRLLMGMADYHGPVRLHLSIVGAWDVEIERLVEELRLESQVEFIPAPDSGNLKALIDQAHLAIGGLGLHRKGLSQGSTLKVREYLAWGIPFIISHEDVALDGSLPLFLRVPPGETPVDIQGLIDFTAGCYEKFRGRTVAVLREYATDRVGFARKIEDLLSFLDSIQRR
jgi:hypothetical protein